MTFTLLVSGFESADLALKLRVLTGASFSAVRGNRLCVDRRKAHSCEMLNWNVQDGRALLRILKVFHFSS